MTGDLAFYFTCLGRENMASTWCCWCSSSKTQWKKNIIKDYWKLESIKTMAK